MAFGCPMDRRATSARRKAARSLSACTLLSTRTVAGSADRACSPGSLVMWLSPWHSVAYLAPDHRPRPLGTSGGTRRTRAPGSARTDRKQFGSRPVLAGAWAPLLALRHGDATLGGTLAGWRQGGWHHARPRTRPDGRTLDRRRAAGDRLAHRLHHGIRRRLCERGRP